MSHVQRLRMFAGPNGSGKSTLKSVLRPELLGVYINPDDIGMTPLSTFPVYETGFVLGVIQCRTAR